MRHRRRSILSSEDRRFLESTGNVSRSLLKRLVNETLGVIGRLVFFLVVLVIAYLGSYGSIQLFALLKRAIS